MDQFRYLKLSKESISLMLSISPRMAGTTSNLWWLPTALGSAVSEPQLRNSRYGWTADAFGLYLGTFWQLRTMTSGSSSATPNSLLLPQERMKSKSSNREGLNHTQWHKKWRWLICSVGLSMTTAHFNELKREVFLHVFQSKKQMLSDWA